MSPAGCVFLLDWVDAAVDSTFLWDAFITSCYAICCEYLAQNYLMPEVVEPTSEEGAVPNLIIKRYTAQYDTRDRFLGCPALHKDVNSRLGHLTGGSVFAA